MPEGKRTDAGKRPTEYGRTDGRTDGRTEDQGLHEPGAETETEGKTDRRER